MRIFANVFDLATPVERKVYVSPYSDFKFGIKVLRLGEPTEGEISLKKDGQAITADPELTGGFKTFAQKSAAPGSDVYTVEYAEGGSTRRFKLVAITTDTSVFNPDEGGGEYTAGDGLVLDGSEFSVDFDEVAKKSDIPTKVSDLSNDVPYANQNDVDSDFEEVNLAIDGLADGYSAINEKIPSEATYTNKLADKAFVNSSIATNTANFKGTFNSTSELPETGVTNNDYAFVIGTDSAGNTQYNRYKYNGSAWTFEYTLNNSSFTAQQWATINGGPYADEQYVDDALTGYVPKSGGSMTGPIYVTTTSQTDFIKCNDDVYDKNEFGHGWLKIGSEDNRMNFSGNGRFVEIKMGGVSRILHFPYLSGTIATTDQIPSQTALLSGEYEDGTEFNLSVYVKNA